MFKKLILLIAAALAWSFAGSAGAADCSTAYSVSFSPNPISVTIGGTVAITVTASPSGNSYEFELKKTGTFYGDFSPSSGIAGQSAKVTSNTPSTTFTYTPPASFASYPGNSGDFEIRVKKISGTGCNIKPSGGWPVTNVSVNNTCATALTMSTVPAQSVLGWISGGTATSVTYTPSGALATGGSGAITYSATVLTTGASVGNLALNSSTGGFTFDPASGYTGNYQFKLMADNACAHAEQIVTVAVQNPAVCSAPSLSASSISVAQNTAFNGTLTAAGGIPPYTYGYTSNSPTHGTLSVNPVTGSYTYTPDNNYTGTDSFDLRAASTCTGTNGTNPGTTATISVTVSDAAATECIAPVISAFALTVPYAATTGVVTPVVSGGTSPYLFSLPSLTTTHGTIALTNSFTGEVTFTRDPSVTPVYVGGDSFTLNVASSCAGHPGASGMGTVTMSNNSVTGTYGTTNGNIDDRGVIIIDNTPNPGTPGVITNMATNVGGKNFGVNNSFSIDGIQVMQRDVTFSPHHLVDEAGVTNAASTSYNNFGTSRQTTYFANGQHLFDLDRLRRAANWMRVPSGAIGLTASATIPDATTGDAANLMTVAIPVNQIAATATCAVASRGLRTAGMGTPIEKPVGSCHPAGTYGVITWREFLNNIANARSMYGVVRILVPLQLGTSSSSNNALNVTVGTNNIYGFCKGPTNKKCKTGTEPECGPVTEWCADAPTDATDIKGGAAVAGNFTGTAISIPAVSTTGGQLRVRGSLMFDFVNGTNDSVLGAPGHPIPLANLPFDPRAIYFKVSVPINVNAVNDLTGDGILDNITYISGLTSVITCGTAAAPSYPCTTDLSAVTATTPPVIDRTKVPQEVIQSYNFKYGTAYTGNTDTAFASLWDTPITVPAVAPSTTATAAPCLRDRPPTCLNLPNKYHMLMASGYVDGWYDAFQELNITAQKWQDIGFTVPPNATLVNPLTINDIRSSSFEDLPTYLYTGGLVDMHHHMNVSGLIYVPQSAEIEQKFANQYMYMNGGLVVRDGFFLEGRANSVTLISSDPQSFSSIKINAASIVNAVFTAAYTTLHNDPSATPTGVGLGGGTTTTVAPLDPLETIVGNEGTPVSSRRREWVEIHPR